VPSSFAFRKGPAVSDSHDELDRIRGDLARVARDLGELALRVGDTIPGGGNGSGGEASPDVEAAAFFRRIRHYRRLRSQSFGSDAFSDEAWDIMLSLMLARIEHRYLSLADLVTETRLDRAVIAQELLHLEETRKVEPVIAPQDPAIPCFSLTAETARRMAEMFRSRHDR
jgi:hypothetical protein